MRAGHNNGKVWLKVVEDYYEHTVPLFAIVNSTSLLRVIDKSIMFNIGSVVQSQRSTPVQM